VPAMTPENCDVDAELQISFIEERPVLWDRTSETYKDKNLTLEAWREICKTVHLDIESLDERKRKEIGNSFLLLLILLVTKYQCYQQISSYCYSLSNNSQTTKSGRTLVLMPH
jgi:hypothetical protein